VISFCTVETIHPAQLIQLHYPCFLIILHLVVINLRLNFFLPLSRLSSSRSSCLLDESPWPRPPPILILTLTILILRIVPTKSILTWKGERWLGRVESILRLEGMGEWCRLETWVPPPQGGTPLLLIEAPTPPPTSPAGTPSRYITLKNL
jgi:hypothetical protein